MQAHLLLSDLIINQLPSGLSYNQHIHGSLSTLPNPYVWGQLECSPSATGHNLGDTPPSLSGKSPQTPRLCLGPSKLLQLLDFPPPQLLSHFITVCLGVGLPDPVSFYPCIACPSLGLDTEFVLREYLQSNNNNRNIY